MDVYLIINSLVPSHPHSAPCLDWITWTFLTINWPESFPLNSALCLS
jgi:hypothetical protein